MKSPSIYINWEGISYENKCRKSVYPLFKNFLFHVNHITNPSMKGFLDYWCSPVPIEIIFCKGPEILYVFSMEKREWSVSTSYSLLSYWFLSVIINFWFLINFFILLSLSKIPPLIQLGMSFAKYVMTSYLNPNGPIVMFYNLL